MTNEIYTYVRERFVMGCGDFWVAIRIHPTFPSIGNNRAIKLLIVIAYKTYIHIQYPSIIPDCWLDTPNRPRERESDFRIHDWDFILFCLYIFIFIYMIVLCKQNELETGARRSRSIL